MMMILTNTFPFTIIVPLRVVIDLDISGPRPRRVDIIPSERHPGALCYVISKRYGRTHRIGTVRDGQGVLIKRDPRVTSRVVLVHLRKDGSKYIRITSSWRTVFKDIAQIDEFMKRPEDAHYAPIARVPIELDILSMDNTQYMDIEVLPGMAGGAYGGKEHPIIHYSIKSEFWLIHTIGMVTYGGDILEDKVDGLLERRVTWYGGLEKPIITTTSKYKDGRETRTKHKMENGRWSQIDCPKKRPFCAC